MRGADEPPSRRARRGAALRGSNGRRSFTSEPPSIESGAPTTQPSCPETLPRSGNAAPSTPRRESVTAEHATTTVVHHRPPPDHHRQPSSDHRQPSLTLPHPRPSIVRPRYHRPNTVNPRPNHPRQPSPRRDGWPAARDGGTRRGPGAGRAVFRKQLSRQLSKRVPMGQKKHRKAAHQVSRRERASGTSPEALNLSRLANHVPYHVSSHYRNKGKKMPVRAWGVFDFPEIR
mgnify:CR=1 FL=1